MRGGEGYESENKIKAPAKNKILLRDDGLKFLQKDIFLMLSFLKEFSMILSSERALKG